jgi:hypothetical protein
LPRSAVWPSRLPFPRRAVGPAPSGSARVARP